MNWNSVRFLRCFLLLKYVLKIIKFDFRYVFIGYKELRLLLKCFKLLKYLKFCFFDNYCCMIGY